MLHEQKIEPEKASQALVAPLTLNLCRLHEYAEASIGDKGKEGVSPLSLLALETAREYDKPIRPYTARSHAGAAYHAGPNRPSTAGALEASLLGGKFPRSALGHAMATRRALHQMQVKSARGVSAHWREQANSPRQPPRRSRHSAAWNKSSAEIGRLSDWRPTSAAVHRSMPGADRCVPGENRVHQSKIKRAVLTRHARQILSEMPRQTSDRQDGLACTRRIDLHRAHKAVEISPRERAWSPQERESDLCHAYKAVAMSRGALIGNSPKVPSPIITMSNSAALWISDPTRAKLPSPSPW